MEDESIYSEFNLIICGGFLQIWAPRVPTTDLSPYQSRLHSRRLLTSEPVRKNWDCLCMATYWIIWKEKKKENFPIEGITSTGTA